MVKVRASDKSAKPVRVSKTSSKHKVVRRKERNIASMTDIAEEVRKVAKKKRIKKFELKPWKRSVFLIYDYGTTGHFFYHIPDDQMTQKEFDKILTTHHKMVNVDEDDSLMWLHDHLMDKSMVYMPDGSNAKRNGKWFKFRVPSEKPFGMKGDFLVLSTGFAD